MRTPYREDNADDRAAMQNIYRHYQRPARKQILIKAIAQSYEECEWQ